MNDWIWNIGRMILTEENQSNRRKTFSIPSLSVTNPTWLALDWTQNLAVTARQPPVTPFFMKYGMKSDTCFVYRDLSVPLNVHKGIYPEVLNVSLISCSGVSKFTTVRSDLTSYLLDRGERNEACRWVTLLYCLHNIQDLTSVSFCHMLVCLVCEITYRISMPFASYSKSCQVKVAFSYFVGSRTEAISLLLPVQSCFLLVL